MPTTVSALMPTYNRRQFVPRAIRCFLEQQYPADWDVTLYVIDDGTNRVGDLIPVDRRILHIPCEPDKPKLTLGTKLNMGCFLGQSDYYITWDDDDAHSFTRLFRQVEPLTRGFELTGTSKIFYHNIATDEGWLYSGQPLFWLGGMAWRRSLWEKLKFRDITVGVDTRWQQELKPNYFDVADPTLFVASIHDGNSCPKNTTSISWRPAKLPEFPRI